MTGKEERLTVTLSGGGPWGFRLQGGAGTGLPLIVSKVRRKSRAYRRLCEGDRVLGVNGRSADFLTYDQVMEIADGSGSDLTLEVLRKECDKENLAPITPHVPAKPVKEVDSGCFTKEIVSLTESSTKVSEEKEVPRIQSATLLPKGIIFEDFTDHKMTELPAETKETAAPVQPFTSFSDLQREAEGSVLDASTGEVRNLVQTTVESRQEIKDGKETSFIKKEHNIKSIDNAHGVPDITLDTIDLNNLISATQKKLESFKNGFKQDSLLTGGGLDEVKKTEVSTLTSETLTSETKLSQTETSETQTFESTHLIRDSSLRGESVDSVQQATTVESKQKDAAKREPPPKPKPPADPCFDLFKDVLSEMDPGGSPGGLGFTHSADESSSVVTDTTPFGTTLITKKKKMFSSSSFYEEPQSIYPTVEEQVEMARKIADSLADDTNKKSKGANMFYKRVKRSSKWIHEGPEPSDESAPGTPEVEPPTPDPTQVSFRPSKGPPKLKLILDPRHPLDLSALRSSGFIISEHNVVSPEVCHDLVKDLHSPVGKGAALFAKRKKKSEEWVVDEEKVKALLREQEKRSMTVSTPSANSQFPGYGRPEVKLIKTPWEAAMENPYGFCDAAFARVSPDQLADTVIRAADSKRGGSLSRESSRMEGCLSPSLPSAPYDIYHGKAPKGWLGNPTTAGDLSQTAPTLSVPPSVSSHQPTVSPSIQNGFSSTQKRVFQNFNAVPRLWKGASVH